MKMQIASKETLKDIHSRVVGQREEDIIVRVFYEDYDNLGSEDLNRHPDDLLTDEFEEASIRVMTLDGRIIYDCFEEVSDSDRMQEDDLTRANNAPKEEVGQ